MKRKTVLTIELEHTRVILRKPYKEVIFCQICGTTAEFVGLAEAVELAKVLGLSSPEIFHFCQTTEKKILVCLKSIFENH